MRGWILVLALLAAFARPAAALDRDAVEKLAYGDSEERIAAIAALVAEGDPRAVTVLRALAEGELNGNVVTCPCHGGQFDVTTGQVVGGPPPESIKTYACATEGDDIVVN